MSSTFLPHILHGSPKGMFETINLPNEDVGEIDPFFIGEFYNELGNTWHLYDSHGIPHQIVYNKSILNPLITVGWPRMRYYYRWIQNINLTFYYYGENTFLITFCENEENVLQSDFPPFHSLSINFGDYRSFTININMTNVTSSSLSVPQAFADFLCLCNYSTIKLSGPQNNIVTCKLNINTQNGPTATFGKGWRKFCNKNNIRDGNILEFTTDGHMYTNVIIVEKI